MPKTLGVIEKWRVVKKNGKVRYFVHKKCNNGEIQDPNNYATRSGRNKKVLKMMLAEPGRWKVANV